MEILANNEGKKMIRLFGYVFCAVICSGIFLGCSNKDDTFENSSIVSNYEVKGNVVEDASSGQRENWSSSSTHYYDNNISTSVRATTDQSHAWKAEVDYGHTKVNMETDSDGRGWREK